MSEERDTRPWYRQFWPWFLIALPGSAVIASLATVAIAIHEPDGLVADDYYKEGLAINDVLKRDRRAQALGLSAEVRLIPAEGEVRLALGGQAHPERLKLRLLHPTRAHHDVDVPLQRRSAANYTGVVSGLAPGRWHVQLEPLGREWRLTGRLKIPGEQRTRLTPAVSSPPDSG